MALPNNQTGSVNGVTKYKRATYWKTLAESSANRQWIQFNDETDTFGYYNYPGSPEGNVPADIGSYCSDTNNGVMYMKTTDTVATGWKALPNTVTGQAIETINNIGPTVNGNFTITAGSNITITPGGNSITISSSAANAFTWQQISANQTLVKNNGYFCVSPGGALSLALPSTASSTIGDEIEVTLDGATSWTITQAASQQIRFSGSQTTSGAGGSLASTAAGDTIRLVYQASGKWNVISSIGNLTVT